MLTSTGFRLSPQQRSQWDRARQEFVGALPWEADLAISGELDAAALDRALARLVERHEILRTTFPRLPGMSYPVQRIEEAPAASLSARVVDGRTLALRLPAPCADDRSLEVLVAEIARLYAEQAGGPAAPPVEVQYADVAEAYNQLLESEETEAGRGYWRTRDVSGAARWTLPLEAGGAPPAFEAGRVVWEIDAGLSGAIEALGARASASLAAVLLAGFQVLLARLAGAPDLSVALRFAGRSFEGLEGAVGAFERYLPAGSPPGEGDTLAEVAGRCERACRELVAWQDFFDRELLAGGADVPCLPFALSFDEELPPSAGAGVVFSLADRRGCSARYKLRLALARRGGGLRAELGYDRGLYPEDAARRVADRLMALLRDAVARPEAAAFELAVVSPEDLRWLAAQHGPAREIAEDRTIHALFEEQARRTPEAAAVIAEGERLTFAELDARADRLARRVRAVLPEDGACVGLLLDRGAAAVVGILGILKAGGAYLPLDPGHPPERLALVLEEARCAVVVTRSDLCPRLPAGRARAICVDALADEPAAPSGRERLPEVSARAPAYVLYTSGSTGKPKGVVVEHRSAVNLSAALEEVVYRGLVGLRVSLNAPLTFDASVKQWLQLLRGRTLCVVPEPARLDPAELLAWLRDEAVDVLDCTPSQVRLLLARGLAAAAELPLSLLLVGGEAIDAETWAELAALGRVSVWNLYGPTECTVDATAAPVLPGTGPSLGRALPNVRVHVLDAAVRAVAPGVAGEIYLGGAGVARGYLGQEALTSARFVTGPRGGQAERLYRTGDLGRHREDGSLEFLGRADDQVKIRGFRIEPGEIEAVLREHPAVAEAAVTARGQRLVAYVVPEPGADGAVAALRGFLVARLPEYMVPGAFVPLPRLPLTRNGKVDRAALPEPGPAEGSYEAPASDVERAIAAVWQSVLGVERVGRDSNFFDLGGHSLLMVQVHERLCAAFDRTFPMVELFHRPTVADLARFLGGQEEAPSFDDAEERAGRQREARARRRRRAPRPAGNDDH